MKPPSNFIAGRPNAALLFWFFDGFRCGVPLFVVVLLYINTKIGKNRRPFVWEMAVHLAVAGDVFDGVFLCCPCDILDEIWDLIESVSEGFLPSPHKFHST